MIPEYLSALANHLWQSTLVLAGAALLARLLRRNAARVRYGVWFCAAIKFFVPFSLLVDIGHQFEWRTPPAVAERPISAVANISIPFVVPTTVVPATLAPRSTARPNAISVFLFGVWLCGFVVSVWFWWRSWQRIRNTVNTASPLELDLPMEIPVPVMSSREFVEPAVFGIVRPVLLLPDAIADTITPEQFKAIIIHELCHVRRRDNLTAAIYMMTEAFFWFYPPVRWIGKRLIDERERACDEEVLRLGNEPVLYAEGILHVCKTYLDSPLRCASGVTGADLKKRVRTILSGPRAGDLNLAKQLCLAAALIWAVAMPFVVGMVQGSSRQDTTRPADTPNWEAVSIRPCAPLPPGARGGGENLSVGRMTLNCQSVMTYIGWAYVQYANGRSLPFYSIGKSGTVIEGGPSWIRSDRYTINARAESNTGRAMMKGPMLQTILEDRFKLKFHWERKEIPVYALTVAKGGAKLQPFQMGTCVPIDAAKTFDEQPEIAKTQRRCASFVTPNPPSIELDAEGASVEEFSKAFLSLFVDRPVIDRTGIAGLFNFHMDFQQPPVGVNAAGLPDTTGPSIFTALQEQLGLRLESARGQGDFLVIDSIERPTEN